LKTRQPCRILNRPRGLIGTAFTFLLTLHGTLHLPGLLQAFHLAPLQPAAPSPSSPAGMLWLAAAVLLLAAAALLHTAPRWYWLAALLGRAAAQAAIIGSWREARLGTIVGAVIFAAVVYGAFAWGPFGLRAAYERLVRAGTEQMNDNAPQRNIEETDLAALPAQVQRYLRFVGVVGTPRVQAFRASMTGRIRSSATAPWMPFAAEQHDFLGPPRRYFWLKATRGGVPLDGLHACDSTMASMRIRLLSLLPIVGLSGPEMARTETVTILNDMCIFAPGSLLDPAIRWRELDRSRVEATFTNGPHAIRAVLVFDDSGALVDFHSHDRPALATDGKTFLPRHWSTPIGEYRAMGPFRLATRGEARYAAPGGDYAYIELEVLEVSTEIAPRGGGQEARVLCGQS